MLILAILLKVILILSVLVGAGLALARASLARAQVLRTPRLLNVQRGSLFIAALAASVSLALLIYRLTGSFDASIGKFVIQSPPGYAAGLIVLGAMLGVLRGKAAAIGALVIVAAFSVVGHAAAHSMTSGVTAGFHVAAGAWWTGGLLLLAATHQDDAKPETVELLNQFSRQAAPVVFVLVIAGGWVAIGLVDPWFSAFTTDYGRALLVKIGLATAAVAVAAYNRFRLTPALRQGETRATRALRRNVLIELSLIAALAIVTGILTSNLSPPTSMH